MLDYEGLALSKVREGGHYWYKLLDADLVVTALGHKQTATLLLPVAPDYVAPAVSVQSNVTWALMVAFENSLGLSLNGVLLKVRCPCITTKRLLFGWALCG